MKQISLFFNQLSYVQQQAILFCRNALKTAQDFTSKVFWLVLPFIICVGIGEELNTWSTKKILIVCVLFVAYIKINALIKQRNLSFKYHTFNDVLAKEIMDIKFKLNELIDHNTPCFTKHEHMGSEMARKEFTRLWFAYHPYPGIAKLTSYETPDGNEGAMIILSQLDDPFSDMKYFNEEELIKLHTNKARRHLKLGDTISAYVYDMEYWGFLEPHEARIKVVGIEENGYDSGRNITFEIAKIRDFFGIEELAEPCVRTIKYFDL